MFVGAKHAGLSISETVDVLSLEFTQYGAKQQQQQQHEKHLLTSRNVGLDMA